MSRIKNIATIAGTCLLGVLGAGMILHATLMAKGKTTPKQKDVGTIIVDSATFTDKSTPNSTIEKKHIKNIQINDVSRVLFLYGPVFDNALELAEDIKLLNQLSTSKPIYLMINSPGGSVLAGGILISAIQASRAPVYTVCDAICASMAAMIHQYGTQRYQVDRALLMFHPASGGAEGEVDKMYSFIGTLKNYVDKMTLEVARRAGMTYDELKKRESVELWLDAEDAHALKMNDAIVSVSLSIASPAPSEGGSEDRIRTNNKFGSRDFIWIQPGYVLPNRLKTIPVVK